ncbi:MAG TPA: hypothetical protein VNH11_21725 [Pirellulales bacterium]|nr:hypothetical protein [Pirellulales bacterium]
MNCSVWLIGQLAEHSRGDVLAEALGAARAAEPPTAWGVCLAFGTEFQDRTVEGQAEWAEWAAPSGRTLVMVPPFRLQESSVPTSWRIVRQNKIDATEARGLPRLLGAEVRYGLAGTLQTPAHLGAVWKDTVINTAIYKKHPHSGVFALTTLPIWSLTVLDHRKALAEWLTDLHQLAGEPAPADDESEISRFTPTADHFAIMLHLCHGDYESREAALVSLAESPVLGLPQAVAVERMHELEEAGLMRGAQLTAAGRGLLLSSPYAVYAEAMEAKRG